jgi:NADH:ubiquinone oxidoreductase subunit 6 (subunit J)
VAGLAAARSELPTAWLVAVPAVLALLALAGAALVVLGRARAWALLAAVSVVLVLCLLGAAGLFAALGLGAVVGQALLLLVGPVGCLTLVARRPVREWTRPVRATRTPERNRRTHRSG